MNVILVILLKEIIDNLRDRKTIISSILMGSLLGPFIFIITINIAVEASTREAHSTLELPIINQNAAQGFIHFLKRQSVEIKNFDGDPSESIKQKSNDVILLIDSDFSERFSKGSPAKIELYYNAATKGAGNIKIDRVRNLINQYSQSIGATRLQLRGIHPVIQQAVFVENHDVSTAETRGASFLAVMPFFLMMGIFIGGMYLAIDATAGEKERGSLEPLLINPAKRSQLIIGKLSATVVFSMLNLFISLIGFKVCMLFLPVKELGFDLSLSFSTIMVIVFLLFPICLLASSLQIIIGTYSKSFREAQTYTGLLTLVPMFPMLLLMMIPIKEKFWMMAIPILSQNMLIEKLIGNQEIAFNHLAVAAASTLGFGVLGTLAAVHIYKKEMILFSNH